MLTNILQFDTDHDGLIPLHHLALILDENNDGPLQAAETRVILKAADKNRDGQLNFDEFAVLVNVTFYYGSGCVTALDTHISVISVLYLYHFSVLQRRGCKKAKCGNQEKTSYSPNCCLRMRQHFTDVVIIDCPDAVSSCLVRRCRYCYTNQSSRWNTFIFIRI